MPFPKGTTHTPEARTKMARSRTGKRHSDEHRRAIAEAMTGRQASRTLRHCKNCGVEAPMVSGQQYCSRTCGRGARGTTLLRSPEFARFDRRCAICGATTQLVGDHDHETGEPRGILCRQCNLAVGNLRDDPALARAAALYLEDAR